MVIGEPHARLALPIPTASLVLDDRHPSRVASETIRVLARDFAVVVVFFLFFNGVQRVE